MSDQQNDDKKYLLLDRNYDGIEEMDYPLPSWWVAIFYITIIFSVFYCGYYLTGIGPSLRDELASYMKEINAKKAAQGGGSGIPDDQVLASFHDPNLKHGQEVYMTKCLPCHGDKGQGVIGPNLTDDYWIHGSGQPGEVATTIRDGVNEKGMPSWGAVLAPQDILDVAAYVRSLHGTNPPNGKAPQGDQHEFKNL